MPLQNRVDPFGQLHAVPYRGNWMGNRGLLHNDRQEIVRQSQLKRWIYCKLEFKGWHRKVMRSGHYTELFFLDEATALAAGHRPCMECQRERATEFKRIWNETNEPVKSVSEIDEVLRHSKNVSLEDWTSLPSGAIFTSNGIPCRVENSQAFLWDFRGYSPLLTPIENPMLVTPQPIVNVLRAGFTVESVEKFV